MRKIVKDDQRFVRDELTLRRRARSCSPTSRTSRRSSRRCARATPTPKTRAKRAATTRASPCTATSCNGDVRVHRPVPRPARAVDRQARRVQAHEGGRRVLARQREGPDAPAHLRHRVGVEGRARRAPAPAGGSREARPPQARRRARPVLVPRGDRLGPRGVPPEGRARAPHHGGVLARSGTRRAATSS